MVETGKSKPTIINGIFVVPEAYNMKRLIIDARNDIKAFSPPSKPDFTNPGILSD